MYPLLTVATSVQSCMSKIELSLCWEIYCSLQVIEVCMCFHCTVMMIFSFHILPVILLPNCD